MNKETIETIIANLAEKGYKIERKEIGASPIYVDYGDCMFYFELGNAYYQCKNPLKKWHHAEQSIELILAKIR